MAEALVSGRGIDDYALLLRKLEIIGWGIFENRFFQLYEGFCLHVGVGGNLPRFWTFFIGSLFYGSKMI